MQRSAVDRWVMAPHTRDQALDCCQCPIGVMTIITMYDIIKAVKLHGLICKLPICFHLTISASRQHEIYSIAVDLFFPQKKSCDPSNQLKNSDVDYF